MESPSSCQSSFVPALILNRSRSFFGTTVWPSVVTVLVILSTFRFRRLVSSRSFGTTAEIVEQRKKLFHAQNRRKSFCRTVENSIQRYLARRQLAEGNHRDVGVAGQILRSFVKNLNEWLVRCTMAEVLPPVRDKDT